MSMIRKIFANFHYAGTLFLAILAIPAIRQLHLPMTLDWRGMLTFYWFSLGSYSILYAFGFCVLAFPPKQTISPFLDRYRAQKLRIVLAVTFLLVLRSLLPWTPALLFTIDALFLVELAERAVGETISFRRRIVGVAVPAAYLFIGISLVMIYNDIIVASRTPISYDGAFNRMDMRMLGGKSVSEIAHLILATAPPSVLRFLDFAYFQMFLVVGMAFLVSAYSSLRRGLRFAGTCLTAYYLALLIFYVWPTYGPYIYCTAHLERYPQYLTTYAFHRAGIACLQALVQHRSRTLASDYYIAFPSLHIALPMIAMWFLRGWRRIFWLLAGYNAVIAAAILVLEWHYAVDLVGGVAVGVLVLVMLPDDELLTGHQN